MSILCQWITHLKQFFNRDSYYTRYTYIIIYLPPSSFRNIVTRFFIIIFRIPGKLLIFFIKKVLNDIETRPTTSTEFYDGPNIFQCSTLMLNFIQIREHNKHVSTEKPSNLENLNFIESPCIHR